MRKVILGLLVLAAAVPLAGCGPSHYDPDLCGIYSDLYQLDGRGDTLATRDKYCER